MDVQNQKLVVECGSESEFSKVCEKLRYCDWPGKSFRMIRDDFIYKQEKTVCITGIPVNVN